MTCNWRFSELRVKKRSTDAMANRARLSRTPPFPPPRRMTGSDDRSIRPCRRSRTPMAIPLEFITVHFPLTALDDLPSPWKESDGFWNWIQSESAAAEGRQAQVDCRPNLWRDHGRRRHCARNDRTRDEDQAATRQFRSARRPRARNAGWVPTTSRGCGENSALATSGGDRIEAGRSALRKGSASGAAHGERAPRLCRGMVTIRFISDCFCRRKRHGYWSGRRRCRRGCCWGSSWCGRGRRGGSRNRKLRDQSQALSSRLRLSPRYH